LHAFTDLILLLLDIVERVEDFFLGYGPLTGHFGICHESL
jgi:hypothetical protein